MNPRRLQSETSASIDGAGMVRPPPMSSEMETVAPIIGASAQGVNRVLLVLVTHRRSSHEHEQEVRPQVRAPERRTCVRPATDARSAVGRRRRGDAAGVEGTARGTRREGREQPLVGRWVQSIFGPLALSLLVAAPSHAGLFPDQTIPLGSSPQVVAIGDLTGDGRADVAVATGAAGDSANDESVFIFAQTEDGTLDSPVRYSIGLPARGIA